MEGVLQNSGVYKQKHARGHKVWASSVRVVARTGKKDVTARAHSLSGAYGCCDRIKLLGTCTSWTALLRSIPFSGHTPSMEAR